jgi:hypothetical protein
LCLSFAAELESEWVGFPWVTIVYPVGLMLTPPDM